MDSRHFILVMVAIRIPLVIAEFKIRAGQTPRWLLVTPTFLIIGAAVNIILYIGSRDAYKRLAPASETPLKFKSGGHSGYLAGTLGTKKQELNVAVSDEHLHIYPERRSAAKPPASSTKSRSNTSTSSSRSTTTKSPSNGNPSPPLPSSCSTTCKTAKA